jgi:uncharacterized membrane protein
MDRTYPMPRLAQSACFIVGLLVGLAIVTATFAMASEEIGANSVVLAVSAVLTLAAGIAVQFRFAGLADRLGVCGVPGLAFALRPSAPHTGEAQCGYP